MTIPADLAPLLSPLGIAVERATATPLPGGVSSDIQLIADGEHTVVAKRALAQLRVAAVWEAPVERSASEAAWLAFAGEAVPGCCPRLLAFDAASGWVVMDHLDPATHSLWKADLLAGRVDPAVAAELGRRLGRLHATAAADPQASATFANDHLFDPLRLDPYLRSLLPLHPGVARRIEALIETTRTTKRSVVHGDVSPKNVLVGAGGPVLLDAECAWWGDPAFDLAFLLTHLVLKSVHHPDDRTAMLGAADAFIGAYAAEVAWEPVDGLHARVAALLPAITLARVDGKSPVEYLDDDARDLVRRRSLVQLAAAPLPLAVTVPTLAGERS